MGSTVVTEVFSKVTRALREMAVHQSPHISIHIHSTRDISLEYSREHTVAKFENVWCPPSGTPLEIAGKTEITGAYGKDGEIVTSPFLICTTNSCAVSSGTE